MRSMTRRIATAVALELGLVAGTSGEARADLVLHFNNGTAPGQFPNVTNLLNVVGIGGNNVASETGVSSFLVPGSGVVNLTFRVEVDGGSFFYEFGYYDPTTVTADPINDKQNYAVQ